MQTYQIRTMKLVIVSASLLYGILLFNAANASSAADHVEVIVDLQKPGTEIDPKVYGQFSEQFGRGIYEGIWVGEESPIPNINGYRKDVVEALKKLRVPVLRWPGGCFADTYHWRDGIGPREKRPVRLNFYYGGTESNAFGTHEFFDFAELIGAEPYLTINVGTGSMQEAAEWIEYITTDQPTSLADERSRNGRAKPWSLELVGIGNENWQCGGNMRPQFYADQLRRYMQFLARKTGIHFIATGPLNDDGEWTDILMKNQSWTYPHSDLRVNFFQGLSLHYYTHPHGGWTPNLKQGRGGYALGFDERAWAVTLNGTLRMEGLLKQHSQIMDRYDPEKKVALIVDEWGASYTPDNDNKIQYQQNSLRDALIAALNFNIFHRHTDRVKMTNISMMVNQLQSIILTDKEKMILTPTYHVFDLYQPFKGATPYPLSIASNLYRFDGIEMPRVSASAAKAKDGKVWLALVNVDPHRSVDVHTNLTGEVSGRVLTAQAIDSHNRFDAPGEVKPAPYAGSRARQGGLNFEVPPKAIVVVSITSAGEPD